MASKWVKIKGKFPDAPLANMSNAGEKGFIEKVDEEKRLIAAKTLAELIDLYTEVDDEKDALAARVKELNVRIEAIGQTLVSRFADMGTTSLKTSSGKTLYLNIEPYISVTNREAFEKWVAEHPDLDYLWSVHPGTLASLVKDHLEKGEDAKIPPDVSIFLKTSVRLRNS